MNKDDKIELETVSVNTNETEQPEDDIIKQLNSKIEELNDKYLRIAAELENTRRRSLLDIESVSRNRAMSVAEKILPVMDAIEQAMKMNGEDNNIKALFQATTNAFTKIGITKIESVGQILNPKLHNAIQTIEKTDNTTATNTIVEELQSGYMFGDTILRTAMVIVTK